MRENIFQDGTNPEIIKAIETNFFSFGTTQLARWSRIEVHDEPYLLWFKCDVPAPMFNINLRASLSQENVDHIIARQQSRYAERNLPVLWWTNPSSTPLDISRHLISAGFMPNGELAGMAINLQKLVNGARSLNLVIEPANGIPAQLVFARTLCQGFNVPQDMVEPMIDQTLAMDHGPQGSLINYIGFLEGQPVATSSLFLKSGVAGIYNVSTLPSMRRRGFGTAITMASLLEAKKRGYSFSVLHASAMATPLYQRLGFKTYCYFHEYLWPNSAQNRAGKRPKN
jgi:ribosomal protein S18 acetylase RimI-like enzyme